MLRSKILKIEYLILLTTKITLNAKINEVKGEIFTLTAVENKIPNVSNLI